MLRTNRSVSVLLIAIFCATTAVAQTEIASIPFESIPGGTSFVVGAGQPIELQSDTNVTGALSATGEVSTGTGFQFADGTVQVTAGAVGAGITANAGLYSNTIADITPTEAFTEVCFKSGAMQFDIHAAAEPTAGGNCMPGDIGWIIDRFERNAGTADDWTTARAVCLMDGMRLPEPFEFQFTCDNAALLAVIDMEDDSEWVSNEVSLDSLLSNIVGAAVLTGGSGTCDTIGFRWAGLNTGFRDSAQFRCLR